MAYNNGPTIVRNGLVLALDAADKSIRNSAFYYKWWTTVGGNPTTKAGFDAFFTVTPQSFGVTYGENIDWVVVDNRPSYITPITQFAWEVTGFIYIDIAGQYIFNTRSDDGNELQINDQIVTSFYGGRGVPTPGDVSSPITLSKGYHKFQYRMQQGEGGAGAQLRWQRPGSSTYEVIPSRNFAVTLDNGVFVDITSNKNDGLLINDPTFDSANGGGLVFDAIDDYISIPSFTFTPYCLDFWLYNNNLVPANGGAIGGPSTYQTLIHYPGGMISLGGWTGAATNEALHIWSFTGGSRLTYTRTAVPVGNHHWVFNWNGTHYDIWVDGQKQTVYAGTGGHALLGSLTNAIRLGYDGNTYYFHGKIYSFKMYGSQRTDTEILQNYNATKWRYGL